MNMEKRKKLPTKEIKRIIEKNYQNAAFLFNDRDNVKKLLAELEEYIANNTTIIDSFEDIRKLILIIRDVSDDKCNTISPGCIVSILSVLIYFKELTSNSDYKTILGIRSDLSNYLQKSFKADYKEYTEWEV